MASLPKVCFCSKQCEHQKAPYILAPAAFRRLASSTVLLLLSSVTLGCCTPRDRHQWSRVSAALCIGFCVPDQDVCPAHWELGKMLCILAWSLLGVDQAKSACLILLIGTRPNKGQGTHPWFSDAADASMTQIGRGVAHHVGQLEAGLGFWSLHIAPGQPQCQDGGGHDATAWRCSLCNLPAVSTVQLQAP